MPELIGKTQARQSLETVIKPQGPFPVEQQRAFGIEIMSLLGLDFEASNLAGLFTRVQPGLIRVDADELTYPAHVILRYEIERALMDGEIEAEDIPALWDEKMMAYLGIDSRGNFQDGCMQDIHWPGGSFGYFPCYTLGSMYAAQFFATIRSGQPDLDVQVLAGNLTPVFNWLEKHIWREASRWPTGQLVKRATGEALNPAHFRRHLEQRYLGA